MRFCEMVRTNPIGRATAFAVLGLFAIARPATAASIYVDFGAFNGAPSSLFAAAAGDAGVWNNVTLLGTTSGLLAADGTATGVGITVAAASIEGTGGPGSADLQRLLHDNFLTTSSGAWSVSLTGLADGIYDLYLYDPSNSAVSSGSGSANGVSFTSINGAFNGSLISNVNYLRLSSVLVTGGLLTTTGAEAGGLSGLAGLQLVAQDVPPATVPEPGMGLLLACGLLALASVKGRLPTAGA